MMAHRYDIYSLSIFEIDRKIDRRINLGVLQGYVKGSDQRVNPEGLIQRKVRESFADIMDGSAAELLSQTIGKYVYEQHKKHKIITELTTELQMLATSMYHISRDGSSLIRQKARLSIARRTLERNVIGSFMMTTKYQRLTSQLQSLLQDYFKIFMAKHELGVNYHGELKINVNFDSIKFSTSGTLFFMFIFDLTVVVSLQKRKTS